MNFIAKQICFQQNLTSLVTPVKHYSSAKTSSIFLTGKPSSGKRGETGAQSSGHITERAEAAVSNDPLMSQVKVPGHRLYWSACKAQHTYHNVTVGFCTAAHHGNCWARALLVPILLVVQ